MPKSVRERGVAFRTETVSKLNITNDNVMIRHNARWSMTIFHVGCSTLGRVTVTVTLMGGVEKVSSHGGVGER